MIAMRYGCLPVVSSVGGLRDTVTDEKTGFVIGPPTAARLASAIKRVAHKARDETAWNVMQRAAMAQDFSWARSAREYLDLYERVLTASSVNSTDGEVAPGS
jgi:starch synthase